MRRYLGLALFFLLLSSCTFGLNTMGYTAQHEDLDTAWHRVASQHYIDDPGLGYWKSPTEFFADGGGDCEDFSCALLYLIGRGEALIVVYPKTGDHHCVVRVDGQVLEPQVYGRHYVADGPSRAFDIECVMSYDEAMLYCTAFGTKDLGDAP